MLKQLTIDNYALIDKSTIELMEGFTVITGETGAGKSIMLDALGLLKGQRADSKAIADKERKTVVEAVFSNPSENLRQIFEENNIDWDPSELIIRREISANGKNRSFINDTPVNLSLLTLIADSLLEIHSQNTNSLLNKPKAQLEILDAFGNTEIQLEDYQIIFKKYVALRNKIKTLKENLSKGKENKEFIMFRLEQLDKLKPKKGELAELEREFEILGDADRLKEDLSSAYDLIGGAGASALHRINTAVSALDRLDFSLFDPRSEDNLQERLNNLKIELRDISDTLEGYAEKINSDPQRLEKLQQRIDRIYEVMKRFKVKDENELVDLHNQLKRELSELNSEDTDLPELESKLKELAKELKEKADALTEVREKAAQKFAETLQHAIMPLGLPNVKMNVSVEKGKMTSEGQDIVAFYCSFNKNHAMKPISEIASGGEIARVMLGIKSIMAQKMNLPTIIFDEIDTGVSGEIAHKMGKMMKEMSQGIQVLSVTHLPQVAANGDMHLKVYKTDENDKTVSHVRNLNNEERITEIAGMLSGTEINDVALQNAKMLLAGHN